MGYTLKLDIYYFSLRKILSQKEVERRGEKRTKYITEDDDICFETFFKNLYGDKEKDNLFKGFTSDFYKTFNDSFISSIDTTKAISINNEDNFRIHSIQNIIWGSFLGGDTNIEFDVYKRANSKEIKNKLFKEDVAALHYFYKLWMPVDSNTGILMVQSYTTTGCTSLFRNLVEECFISLGYKMNWAKCIPKKIITKYLSDCSIYKLKIVTKTKRDNELLNPIFSVFKKSKYERYLDKFRIPLSNLLNLDNHIELLKNQLIALDIDYDKDRDNVIVFYKNSKGQQAHSSLSDMEDVYPSIILDNSLKDPETEKPLWNELNTFTNGILKYIKEEMGYSPVDLN